MQRSFEELVLKISEKSGTSQEQILARVSKRMMDLAGLVSKEGAAHIIANELGVDLFEEMTSLCSIAQIAVGMKSVDVAGMVQACYEVRSFQSQRGSGKVGSLLLADKTGVIRVTFWNAKTDELKNVIVGDVILVKNVYVRDNNGKLEVHLNDKSAVVKNPENISINISEIQKSANQIQTSAAQSGNFQQQKQRKFLNQITASDQIVEVFGTVVQLFDPYFFEVCALCQKRLRQKNPAICEEHGQVSVKYSCVLNAILDDGSENMRAVFFRELASSFLGISFDQLLDLRVNQGQMEEIKTKALGMFVVASAKVSSNQLFNRLELVVRSIETKPDPQKEIKIIDDIKNSVLSQN